MAYVKAKDRIGTILNGFYIEDVERRKNRTYCYAICPYCKNKKWIRIDCIINGKNISCGCYNAEHNYIKSANIKNKKFGYLKAICPTDQRDKHNSSVVWECKCKCGNITYVSEGDLAGKRTRSCGCLAEEVQSKNGKIAGGNVVKKFCVDGTNIKNLTMKTPSRNTSGVKGVCWDKSKQKWLAQIRFKGKNHYLGRYNKKEDAVKIRKIAEENLFGNFLEWYAQEYPERWKNLNKKENSVDKN